MDNLHNSMQDNQISPTTVETAKEKHQRLFNRGCRWVGVGVLTLGLSFGVNFVLFHSNQSFVTAMYILTTLGAACTIKGMADIIGF